MNIDYKKSFEKLVEQIKFEHGWALDVVNAGDKVTGPGSVPAITYNRGMLFAYRSILELAEKLEKGEFDFDEVY